MLPKCPQASLVNLIFTLQEEIIPTEIAPWKLMHLMTQVNFKQWIVILMVGMINALVTVIITVVQKLFYLIEFVINHGDDVLIKGIIPTFLTLYM